MLVSPSSHECLTRGKSNSENVIILFAGFGDVIFILHILENFSILLNVFWDEFDWNDILLDSLLNSCLSQSLELEYINQLNLVTPPASDHRHTQPPTSLCQSPHSLPTISPRQQQSCQTLAAPPNYELPKCHTSTKNYYKPPNSHCDSGLPNSLQCSSLPEQQGSCCSLV